MKVALIGLGIMGSRMAANLHRAGFDLTVNNRTKEKAEILLAEGATWADSPAKAARDAEIVLTMLAHPEAVQKTATGEAGFLAAMKPNTLWIDSSTLNPTASRQFTSEAEARGVRFLDAPVAGSKQQAEAAQLVFFVGGETRDVEQAKPLFRALGSKTVHVGKHGAGTSLKMVVNHLLASTMVGFAEAVSLGEALGLPQSLIFNVLIGGSVTPPYLISKREKLESGNYDPEFPLKWIHKDMDMVTLAAQEANVSTPLAELVKAHYRNAVKQGWGEMDFSAYYGFLQHEKNDPEKTTG